MQTPGVLTSNYSRRLNLKEHARVVSSANAASINTMMEAVVNQGTGSTSSILGCARRGKDRDR